MPPKKSERINLMVTPAMKKRWEKWAKIKDMTISDYVRHCVEVCTTMYESRK